MATGKDTISCHPSRALVLLYGIDNLDKQDLSFLSKQERVVVLERLSGKTLKEVGLSLYLTKERIRQIEEKATRRIIWRYSRGKLTNNN